MMTPTELEEFLTPPDYFVTHTKKETYEQILGVLTVSPLNCGVGFHRSIGWFVLGRNPVNMDAPPALVWSQTEL